MNKIKSINYILNDDQETYNIKYVSVDETGNEMILDYPKVKIEWYEPKRVNYFNVPIPNGVAVLSSGHKGNLFNFTVPNELS